MGVSAYRRVAVVLLAWAVFPAWANAQTASSLVMTELAPTVTAGVASTFRVTALDGAGQTATGYTGTVQFGSNFPATTVPGAYTFVAADAGSRVFTFTPREAGAQILSATQGSLNASGSTTVQAAAAAQYVIANLTNGSNLNAGVAADFDITAYDAFWNVATGYAGTAVVTTDDTQATLPPPAVFSNGLATGVLITFRTAGARWVTATDSVNPSIEATAWAVVDAGPNATITAPANATTGATGLQASVPSQSGATYEWTIPNGNGTITAGSTANVATFTAGSVGPLTLRCVVTRAGASSTGNATVNVVAAPATPTITAASPVTTGATGRTATVPARTGMTYTWTISGGTITAGGAGGQTSGGVNKLTFTAGAVGTITITCVEKNAAGAASIPATAAVQSIAAPVKPTITSTSPVAPNTPGRTASVTARAGMTYVWTITNATLTNPNGTAGETSGTTNTLTFTSGASGTINLTCVERNAAGTQSAAATRNVTITAPRPTPTQTPTPTPAPTPSTPAITAASPVTSGATGRTAWVTAVGGMTYTWTISGGTITSAGGTAGVTSGGRNTITYTAGAPGTIAFTCVERNSGGVTSSPGTANVLSIAAPVAPTLTAASPVNEGDAGLVASVVARAGMTYSWTIAGGTFTNPSGAAGETIDGTNSITFTAGASGTLALTCVEINAAGTQSAPGTRSVTVVGAPATPVVTAASPVSAGATGRTASVTARGGMTYTWTISGGTVTSAGGTAGVTSGGLNTITYTAGAPGTIDLTCVETNSAGSSSSPGSASVTVVEFVPAPVISATSPVEPGATGLTASVTATAGTSYNWTVSNAAITSPGGAAGVTSGGVNTITFTSGSSGTITLSCVATSATGGTSNPGTATVQIQAPGGAGHMYFVAHQDDDLLFINPAIEYSIESGRPVQVVYETAGDDGSCQACWEARENGVHNSYADMAGVAKAWTCASSHYAGKSVRKCTLTNAPQVSLVFMRLPDGGLASLWSETFGPPFWVSPVGTLSAVDGTATYTKAQIIQTVAALISDAAPARIATLDSTFAYGEDHGDHITSALIALAASHYYPAPHELQQYRGYNIDGNYFDIPTPEIANLSAPEYAEKVRIMESYAGGFPAGSDFDNWCHRNYGVSRLSSGSGALTTSGGLCLAGRGGSTADGTPVDAVACTGTAGQRWTVTANDEIRTSGGKCLTVAADHSVQISACLSLASQKWTLTSNGQVRSTEALCLTNDAGAMQMTDCDASTSTNKYTVLDSQRFIQTSGPSTIRSAGADFSNADILDSQSYWGTLRFGDVNGDHFVDACVRREAGVYCASNDGAGGFSAYSLYSADFSDAAGWFPPEYGATLQLGDINGDGRADVCGRSANGIACATANAGGTAFGAPTAWSVGTDFSDAAGFAAGASYWGSVRLADVDGDRFDDVCGRTAAGVRCALNTGSGAFAASTPWVTNDFTDAAGWQPVQYGSTLQLGDINGDGRADVCGRGPAGVRCAIAARTGTGFLYAHPWSLRSDFSDADGWGGSAGSYGSIRLADVNGDSYADLCGRGTNGLVCGISNGITFDRVLSLTPGAYTNALGWSVVRYGSSLQWGDVNRDGHTDVCGLSSVGLACSTAP